MRKKMDSNTIALFVSATDFAHGKIEPIPEVAALARKYKVGCHVDGSMGGFILMFAEEAGFPLTVRKCTPHIAAQVRPLGAWRYVDPR